MAEPLVPLAAGGRGHVKICGLSTDKTVEAALRAGADLIGFVFVPASPRSVTAERAAPLSALADGRARRVGLFADADIETIARSVETAGLDVIQLHGTEAPETIDEIRAVSGANIYLARGIAAASDLPGDGGPLPEAFLFDAKPPKDAAVKGGHGVPFDWSVLAGFSGVRPFLLAGGLTPDTVGEAVAAVARIPGFAGVDVSSGVEKARGIKDEALIADFVAAARAAMAQAFPSTP